MYREHNRIQYVIRAVAVIILVVVVTFQVHGAKECAEEGGQYLRNWANWPTCVQVK